GWRWVGSRVGCLGHWQCRGSTRVGGPRGPPVLLLLAAQAQLGDELTITLDVVVAYVVEQSTSATDQLHQATAGVMITLVNLEMLGQVGDTLAEDGDLHLWRSRIGLVGTVSRDRGGFVWHEYSVSFTLE